LHPRPPDQLREDDHAPQIDLERLVPGRQLGVYQGPEIGFVAALLIRVSIRPRRSSDCSTSFRSSSSRPPWAAIATALPARFEFNRAASWSRSACLRLASTTVAPCSTSASVIASPIPLLAPVTRATRPSTE